jgi:hypothetical protein
MRYKRGVLSEKPRKSHIVKAFLGFYKMLNSVCPGFRAGGRTWSKFGPSELGIGVGKIFASNTPSGAKNMQIRGKVHQIGHKTAFRRKKSAQACFQLILAQNLPTPKCQCSNQCRFDRKTTLK